MDERPHQSVAKINTQRALRNAQSNAEFWEHRYNMQHAILHRMEDELAALRQRIQTFEQALDEVSLHFDISDGALGFLSESISIHE